MSLVVILLTAGLEAPPTRGLAALEAGRYEEAASLLSAEPSPSYEALVGLGVAEGRLGRAAAAEAAFARALAREPGRPEALVERGGLAFLEGRYAEAARDLERALERGEEPYARGLLAASMHLLGREDEALASWNRLAAPRLEHVEISGLQHTRDLVARRELRFREGDILLLPRLKETRRRLVETGAFEQVTFRLHPRSDSATELEVALLERRGLGSSRAEALLGVVAPLADRRLALRYDNLGGTGAAAFGSWRFAEGRPELAVGLAWPRPFGLDANVRLVARRGRLGLLLEEPVERSSHGLDAGLRRVLGAEVVAELGFAYRNRAFSSFVPSAPPGVVAGPFAAVEWRPRETARERIEATARGLLSHGTFGADLGFVRGVAALRYERALGLGFEQSSLVARVLVGAGPSGMPLDEGFAPGGGPESAFPLRGHRQFTDGVAGETPLGRALVLANLEARLTLYRRGAFRLGVAAFYDAARPLRGLSETGWMHDVGAGLRFGLRGTSVRLDVGHGLSDGSNAVTLGVGQAF